MTAKANPITSLITPLFSVIVLAGSIRCSSVLQKVSLDVKSQEACNASLLSSIVSEIRPNQRIQAQDQTEGIMKYCPNLKYSCCKFEQLKGLADHISESYRFLEQKKQLANKLLARVEKISDTDFKGFLKKFKSEEIKCFNFIQKTKFQADINKAKGNPVSLELTKKKIKTREFNVNRIMNEFLLYKDLIKTKLLQWNDLNDYRKQLHTGFICSMCAPSVQNYFLLDDLNHPKVEVHVNMCRRIVQEQVALMEVAYTLYHIEELAFLSYCARNGFESEKNYQGVGLEELTMIHFNHEFIQKEFEKLKRCDQLNAHQFMTDPHCKYICKKHLSFFDYKVVPSHNYINVENEIRNMFSSESKIISTSNRRNTKIRRYNHLREQFVAKENVRVEGDDLREVVNMIHKNLYSPIKFNLLELEMSSTSGLNVFYTTMRFPNGFPRILASASLLFSLVFFFREN